MATNKVIYGETVLIDLTGDTVSADKLATGLTAHDKTGTKITGTNDYDANTQDATAAVAEVLSGKTYYGQGEKKSGTMPNKGAVTLEITTKAEEKAYPPASMMAAARQRYQRPNRRR